MLHLSVALVLLQAPAQPTPAPAQPAPVAQPQPTAPTTAPPPSAPPEATQPTSPPTEPATPPTEPYPATQPAPPPQPAYQYPYTPYPSPSPANPLAPELPEDVTHRKLVFANFYGLGFGLTFPIPSADFAFFLGTNLRPRKNFGRNWDWNTAIGYQFTLSSGGADIDAYERGRYRQSAAFLVHRHHLTAMGIGGANKRLFYALGGGAWFALEQLAGVEIEGRLGYVFSRPEGKRVKGVVGGQARLGGAFEGVPIPQLGIFIGYMIF